MKEQDAAHSFEEKETCPTCGNVWGDENGKFCSNSWHLATPYIMSQLREYKHEAQQFKEALITRDGKLTNKAMQAELTRLRSELQQKDEDYLSFYRWVTNNGWEEHSSGRYFFKLEYQSQWPPSENNCATGEDLIKKWRDSKKQS